MNPLYTIVISLLAAQSISCFIDLDWQAFKLKYDKHYSNKAEEDYRHSVYDDNKRFIDRHNGYYLDGKSTYKMGINKYADMTPSEFQNMMMNPIPVHRIPHNGEQFDERYQKKDVPESIDWRDYGYVTGVKDQGQCGSCWAFSTTGSLEGQHFAKTGTLVSLSEQQLVDCSLSYDNFGCEGGYMDNAFDYIIDNNGIDTEAYYKYEARVGKCHYNSSYVGATCSGYVDITSGDENKLKDAVGTVGPVSVAVDATQMSFQFYTEGVYYEPQCSTNFVNHGMLVVGYGHQDGSDYWTVKNSWGSSWGQDGYILMSRNKNDNCCIACLASYPLV